VPTALTAASLLGLPAEEARDRLVSRQKNEGKAMDMTGEFLIPAPRRKVWEALNDPAILQQCIPGCETIERLSDNEMQAKVVAKVGPVRAHFGGKVTLSDLDPPNGYKISGEGSGGAAGFAKGGATVRLSDEGQGTRLTYKVEAHVGGKLAQIGSRLIDATARKMAEDFFARFSALVGAPVPSAAVEPAATGEPAPLPAATPERKALPPLVWVTGLIVLIAVLLFFFTRSSGH
jgi:uncharacterized protein